MNLYRRRFSLDSRIRRGASALGSALMLTSCLAANASDEVIDFRFAPPVWQTAICLPDDWQKTLVGKDGSLLYDYPGKYGGFGTRILFQPDSKTEWVRQELASPRVPIVRTIQRCGSLEIVQEAFAAAPAPAPLAPPGAFVIERVGAQTGQRAWASPPRARTRPLRMWRLAGTSQPTTVFAPETSPRFGGCVKRKSSRAQTARAPLVALGWLVGRIRSQAAARKPAQPDHDPTAMKGRCMLRTSCFFDGHAVFFDYSPSARTCYKSTRLQHQERQYRAAAFLGNTFSAHDGRKFT